MTWGVNFPASFGKCFPNGEFGDHRSKVEHHFNFEMTEAEREAIPGGVQDLLANANAKFMNGGRRAAEYEKPSEFKALKTLKELGSLIQLPRGLWAVDDAFKTIVETFEPGVHQFWPIEITMPNNTVFPRSYFGMIVQNQREAFSREATDPEIWQEIAPGHRASKLRSRRNPRISELAISQAAVAGAHVWVDQTISRPALFFSDVLFQDVKDKKLVVPDELHKLIDV